ncbi:MAG: hypothetical protein CMJ81_16255 [Planctomycetaceae bacterium]|nr:hypothetical protein [Planctomycetaceae bacterium]
MSDIFCGANQVLIRHGDKMCRLLITRNDKLLLQK